MSVGAAPRPLDLPALQAPELPAIRRTLRAQIARLDAQLSTLLADDALPAPSPPRAAPRLLGVAELERRRDALAARVREARARTAARAERENDARRRLEAMLAAPERHRLERVPLAELGQSGCGAYAVRPRLGLVGMLAGWWEVKLSSGCPLSSTPGRHPAGRRPIRSPGTRR
jgi:hypothetical protein